MSQLPALAASRLSLPLLVGLVVAAPAAGGDAGHLGIELNLVESTAEGCRTLFVFDNRTGRQLNRFRVDLILFDPDGIYKKQLLLDMAPLYPDKKTVASFLLDDAACSSIGSILVNDIPQCQDGVGDAVDCVALLQVTSRAGIPLER
jgi:hypothetical protein